MAALTGESLPITAQVSVETARRLARALAAEVGLSEIETEEVVLVVSELATNLLKHAQHGVIKISAIADQPHHGLLVESSDDGPGIPDIDLALRDGYSSAGGLGSGLGAARRLSDTWDVSSASSGTRITIRKWHKTE